MNVVKVQSIAISALFACVALSLSVFLYACGDSSESEDSCTFGETDDQGNTCLCQDQTGATCDPDAGDETCVCALATPTGGETTCPELECPDPEPNPDPYRFVLVEDLTQNVSGSSPGADLDAVVITKADGTVMPATTVEDFGGIGEGEFTNPSDALGLPDSDCEVTNFVALGGADAGGYIVVGFAHSGSAGLFTGGDTITVHEIGSTMCSNNTYDDDPYAVSVSVSKDLNTFVEIATNVLGNNPITVPAQDSNKSIERRSQGLSCACP